MKRLFNFYSLFKLYWIVFCLIMIYAACQTLKRSAAEKASIARQNEIKQLQQVRETFPCDTTITVIIKTDTTLITHIDSTGHVTDTIILTRYRDRLLLDRAAEKQKRDSIDELIYQLTLTQLEYGSLTKEKEQEDKKNQGTIEELKAEIAKYKPWKTGLIVSGSTIVALLGIGIFLKLKKYI